MGIEQKVLTPHMITTFTKILHANYIPNKLQKCYNILDNYKNHGYDVLELRTMMREYINKDLRHEV